MGIFLSIIIVTKFYNLKSADLHYADDAFDVVIVAGCYLYFEEVGKSWILMIAAI